MNYGAAILLGCFFWHVLWLCFLGSILLLFFLRLCFSSFLASLLFPTRSVIGCRRRNRAVAASDGAAVSAADEIECANYCC